MRHADLDTPRRQPMLLPRPACLARSFFVVRVVLPALLMIAASAASHLFERAWRFFVVTAGIVSIAAPPTAKHALASCACRIVPSPAFGRPSRAVRSFRPSRRPTLSFRLLPRPLAKCSWPTWRSLTLTLTPTLIVQRA